MNKAERRLLKRIYSVKMELKTATGSEALELREKLYNLSNLQGKLR